MSGSRPPRHLISPGALENRYGIASASGAAGVIEYRAYIVGDDGHFLGYEPLICADDSEAITKARCLVRDHDVELWNGTRLVVRLSHTSPG
jgi:hypothetical protein